MRLLRWPLTGNARDQTSGAKMSRSLRSKFGGSNLARVVQPQRVFNAPHEQPQPKTLTSAGLWFQHTSEWWRRTSPSRSARRAKRSLDDQSQSDVDATASQTTSILAPRTSSRGTSKTRQRVIAAGVLVSVVIAWIIIAITQRGGTNDRRMAAPGRVCEPLPAMAFIDFVRAD